MPKIVDKKQKRADIAMAAMGVFAEKGYENTPVREISKSAGIGKGTFYEYFKDKEDVLNEISELMIGQWRSMVASVMNRNLSPKDALNALASNSVAAVSQLEQMTILYVDLLRLSAVQGGDYECVRRMKELVSESREVIEALIEDGKKEGQFKSDLDSAAVSAAILAFIDGVCLHGMIYKGGVDFTAVWEGFYGVLLEGMA